MGRRASSCIEIPWKFLPYCHGENLGYNSYTEPTGQWNFLSPKSSLCTPHQISTHSVQWFRVQRSQANTQTTKKHKHDETLLKLKLHLVECIPPPGWTLYVLYLTDWPDVDPDLNQNLNGLFLSPNQLIHQVLSESVHNYIILATISQLKKINKL